MIGVPDECVVQSVSLWRTHPDDVALIVDGIRITEVAAQRTQIQHPATRRPEKSVPRPTWSVTAAYNYAAFVDG